MDAIQFTKSTNGTLITVGKPYLFKSGIYGDTAVHVTAIHEDVIHFTIDGGKASRQVREFPELSDSTYFALSERIVRRSSVKNTIREVPGIGKVAVVTFTLPEKNNPEEIIQHIKTPAVRTLAEKAGLVKPAEALELPKERRPKRLSLAQAHVQARKMADAGKANWAGDNLADKLRAMTYKGLRQYARNNYSTIGKLTKTADIITAILSIESKKNEVTF